VDDGAHRLGLTRPGRPDNHPPQVPTAQDGPDQVALLPRQLPTTASTQFRAQLPVDGRDRLVRQAGLDPGQGRWRYNRISDRSTSNSSRVV
jgi:hypothetical protein